MTPFSHFANSNADNGAAEFGGGIHYPMSKLILVLLFY
jgi:hypothetical protein